ncbi:major capsid protein [Capybara microvirus Cap3_SP_646]|nr:major capsid protein [Capybara microvirus Cap3_SP_646]
MVPSHQKRSLFLPHSSRIMSLSMGKLYPCLVREMYPNDSIVISHQALLRAAPMLFPLYSPVKLTFDYFFNENRNVWRGDESSDWSAFITGSINGKAIENPDDLPEHPYITVPSGGFATSSLADYLGFNTGEGLAGAKLSALRFRHYQKIVSDYYLDENFSTMPAISFAAGQDTTTSLDLQYRCWNKDRFTTAATSPQKGQSFGISLGDSVPVIGNGMTLGLTNGSTNYGAYSRAVSGFYFLSGNQEVYGQPVGSSGSSGYISQNDSLGVTSDPAKSGLIADLSSSTGISINDLHFLVQLERLNQRDNFWGTRDFECIYTHFGIKIPDTRLQRATFLGRSCVDVNFSEVLQTSESTSNSPQGNITGHSMAVDANNPVRFRCKEHGFLFVIVNIQPIAQYQQGVPRDALYKTRYDYMWPILSETGEQEVYTCEVFANKDNVNQRSIFGFEPRYNHLRFGDKTVHGDFRTNLSAYHAGRIFDSVPNLNENFIKCVPTKRMFAVELEDVDPFWLRVEFDIKHVRRLPKWPSPSAIGKIF